MRLALGKAVPPVNPGRGVARLGGPAGVTSVAMAGGGG